MKCRKRFQIRALGLGLAFSGTCALSPAFRVDSGMARRSTGQLGRRRGARVTLPAIDVVHGSFEATSSWFYNGGPDALASSASSGLEAAVHGAAPWLQAPELLAEASTSLDTASFDMQLEDESAFDAAGRDLLIFLAATSAVVPACRAVNISPVLGFLGAGLLLGPAGFGLFEDLGTDNKVGEIGILFLLFEQGLELNLKRLKALAKYAFGMGLLQIVLCTAAFTLFPFLGGVELLETVVGSDASLVDIRRLDESLVRKCGRSVCAFRSASSDVNLAVNV